MSQPSLIISQQKNILLLCAIFLIASFSFVVKSQEKTFFQKPVRYLKMSGFEHLSSQQNAGLKLLPQAILNSEETRQISLLDTSLILDENIKLEAKKVIPRARGVKRDVSAFWYTFSVSAATSVLFRLLGFFPVVLVYAASAALFPLIGGAGTVALVVGVWFALAGIDSLIAAGFSMLSFDMSSRYYTAHFISSFTGHMLGQAVYAGLNAVLYFFSMMLVNGVTTLGSFAAVASSSSLISFFNMIPFFALPFSLIGWVVLPAFFGAMGTILGATAKPGFTIDSTWIEPRKISSSLGIEQLYPKKNSFLCLNFSLPAASFY